MKMRAKLSGAGGVALAALLLALVPAMAATTEKKARRASAPAISFVSGMFTPAVADPRLAAELGRRGLQLRSFHFTPSSASNYKSKSIRVAIRARAATPAEAIRTVSDTSATPVTAITPAAVNLGVAVGWRRFAISGDVAKVQGGALPGGREAAEVGVSYSATPRLTGRLELGADRAEGIQAQVLAPASSYSLGVGGSFRLTHNLDLTGGVRYKVQRDRVQTLTDERRDSQAVYVGTAFRF
ncbi:MAG: hypothetical protein JWO25_1506 [Alphaproteobacteria bacterium]|nr:hypothetical protein [Alphaproteobacteria bacterium]